MQGAQKTAGRLKEALEKLKTKNTEEKSLEAESLIDKLLKEAELEPLLWDILVLFQEETFQTAKGLTFTYSIKGNEMFVSRKDKSITRSTVTLAFRKAMEIQESGIIVKGPKKLGCFGASYLYPIFIHIGVIDLGKTEE